MEQIGVEGVALGDAPIIRFTGIAVEVEGVVLLLDFVTEPDAEGCGAEGMAGVQCELVADLVHLAEGGNDVADAQAAGLGGVAPGRGILRTFAGEAGVAEGDLGDVEHAQPGFEAEFRSIGVKSAGWRGEPGVAGAEVTAAAIVPSAVLGVADTEEVLVRVIEFDTDGIVVIVEDAAAIDCEDAVVGHFLFEMETLDSAEDIAGQAGPALEGGLVAVDEGAAQAELDPIVVFRGGFDIGILGGQGTDRREEESGGQGQSIEATVGGEGGGDRIHDCGDGLEAEGGVDLRTVDGFVTTGIPAGAALEEGGVIEAADEDLAAGCLLLEMALHAEGGVALGEEFGVDRAMGVVAGGAAFAHGFVFEDVGPTLCGVALVTAFIFRQERGVPADNGVAMMRIMAIGAGQVSFRHRMPMGQTEGTAHIEVTGEADVGGFEGIDDERGVAAGLNMKITRAMTGLASDVDGVGALGLQAGVTGGGKIANKLVMAVGAGAGANIGRARNGGRRHDRAGERGAGEENGGHAEEDREEDVASTLADGCATGRGIRQSRKDRLHIVAGNGSVGVRFDVLVALDVVGLKRFVPPWLIGLIRGMLGPNSELFWRMRFFVVASHVVRLYRLGINCVTGSADVLSEVPCISSP
jgi:hypothetical protein